MNILMIFTTAVVAHSSLSYWGTSTMAAAQTAHLASLRVAGANFPFQGSLSVGIPVVTPEGFIADTPEVAAAKAAHLAYKAQVTTRFLGANSTPDYLRAYTLPSSLIPAFIWTSRYIGPIAIFAENLRQSEAETHEKDVAEAQSDN